MHFASESPQRHVRAQQVLGRDPPHGQDQPGAHEGNLPHEVGQARCDLVRLRIPVARRTAFEHVGDEDIRLTAQTDRLEHGVQKLPGAAHKGFAATILLGAGGLANDEPVRLWIANAEHALRAARVERTLGTDGDFGPQLVPLGGQLRGDLRGRRARRGSPRTDRQRGCSRPGRSRRASTGDAATRHPRVYPDRLEVLKTSWCVHYVGPAAGGPGAGEPRTERLIRRPSHRMGAESAYVAKMESSIVGGSSATSTKNSGTMIT